MQISIALLPLVASLLSLTAAGPLPIPDQVTTTSVANPTIQPTPESIASTESLYQVNKGSVGLHFILS